MIDDNEHHDRRDEHLDDRRDELGQGLGPSRTRVLGLLQDAGGPMTAYEVAERLGMHPNSVRFHLDALAAANDVVRDRAPRSTPGRPTVTYAATSQAPLVARRRYPVLARVLAEVMRQQLSDPALETEKAGRSWSRALSTRRLDSPPTEAEALDTLAGTLREVGFESRAVDDDQGLRIEVTHCPFLEVARDYQEVVCGMHLGLMRGVLEQLRAPIEVEGLEPLVEPGLCRARLSR